MATLDFKEEDRRDKVDGLDEVFTQEESAGGELGGRCIPISVSLACTYH